jgi:hypothetical protein
VATFQFCGFRSRYIIRQTCQALNSTKDLVRDEYGSSDALQFLWFMMLMLLNSRAKEAPKKAGSLGGIRTCHRRIVRRLDCCGMGCHSIASSQARFSLRRQVPCRNTSSKRLAQAQRPGSTRAYLLGGEAGLSATTDVLREICALLLLAES